MSKTSAPHSTAPAPPTIRIALPNGWARSGLAGIEAALIGWGLLMVLTLVGYLSVSGNPWLGKATWADATAVGGDLWGATLAAPVHVGGTTLWAVPTLMTVLVVVLLRVLLLGGRGYPPAAQWMAVPTFAVTALALVGATAGHVSLLQAVPGALLVPALAALWAVVSQTSEAPAWTGRAAWVWEGLRQARVVLGVLALVGAVAVGVSLHASWEQVRGIHELLLAGTTDTVVTVIAQVLFAPTAVAWALSWLAGPGFWVGADTLHAPGTAPVAPIPAIPLLGAVPATAPGNRVALVLVGVGVLVGIWLRWHHRAEDVGTQALAGAASAGGVAVVMLAWFALATLHLGEGRMSLLGPRVAWSAAMVVVEVV
ncbi:cell division protein PerM, partial [Actinomyces provencensis]|uniref:cell division protein PerM n=1 Tax=Actinomyces provencensis TaxID=1720198 RepID=UPI0018A84F50